MWLLAAAAVASTVGTNVHLPPADTLDLADELGGGWVRIDFNWDIAEPNNGAYDWTLFDAVVDAAEARGLRVYATIGYCPAWASVSGDRNGDGPSNDVPDAAEYRQFVTAAAQRYGTRIGIWGTWNEPNLGDFFEGSMQEWLDSAYVPAIEAIRAGCPACTVAGPELATIGDAYDDYLAAALNASQPVDIISAHIYASFPEDDSQAGVSKDSFYNKLESHRSYPPIYEGPLSIREVAVDQGAADLPIWITETGRQAISDDAAQEESQRLYVQRVLDAMEQRAWWGGTIFYELSEEHPNGLWPDIHWGLALRVADPDATYADNFDRKPAFDYLKQRLAASPPGPDAGPGSDAGPGTDAGPSDAGAGGDGGTGDSGGDGGCGCRGGATDPDAFLLLVLVAAMLLRRRRAVAARS